MKNYVFWDLLFFKDNSKELIGIRKENTRRMALTYSGKSTVVEERVGPS